MASHHSIGTGPRSLFSVTRSGSSSKAWRSAAALTLLGLLLPSACGKAEKKAGLIVAVQTDMSIPKDVDAVEIQVSAYGKDIFKRRYNVGKDGDIYIPATITLLPPK